MTMVLVTLLDNVFNFHRADAKCQYVALLGRPLSRQKQHRKRILSSVYCFT